MELERTQAFEEDFKRLPEEMKRRVEKALHLLAANLRHPSLRARVIDKKRRM